MKYFVVWDTYGGEISVMKSEEVIAANVGQYVSLRNDCVFIVLAQADDEITAERFKKLFLESHAA